MKFIIFCHLIILGIQIICLTGKPLEGESEAVPELPTTANPSADTPIADPATADKAAGPAVAPDQPTPAVTEQTKCECAVFNNEAPTDTDTPIILQNPINVSCDAEGREKCFKLCSALAKAAREDGPKLLCAAVGHYNQLRASVHTRICTAQKWTYTGLTSPNEICCHDHKVVECNTLGEAPAPNQL